MIDFHNRIMRVANTDNAPQPVGLRFAYKQGHRDARHAAAEIAIEAEQIIEAQSRALEAAQKSIAELIGEIVAASHQLFIDGYETKAVSRGKNALAQIEAVKEGRDG